MKNKIYVYMGFALILGFLGGVLLLQNKGVTETPVQSPKTNLNANRNGFENITDGGTDIKPNRNNCLADDCLLVDDLEYPAGVLSDSAKEALEEAINDEYKALSTYEAVIARFGAVRPFSMIKGAEEQHIASLKAIYDKYSLPVPENEWAEKITIPGTIKEACQIGVDAEIANAKLYKENLIPMVKDYEDIASVFTNLMNASEQKHLPAFRNCN